MKRFWNGYWDMGTVQVPPLPPKLVLTDRGTGLRKQLSYNTDTNALIAATVDDTKETSIVYTADEGPIFPEDTRYILTLTNGTFGKLLVPRPDYISDRHTSCIYARNGTRSRRVLLSEF